MFRVQDIISCAKVTRLKRKQDKEIRLEVIKQEISFKSRTTKDVHQVTMVLRGEFNLTYHLKSIHPVMGKDHLLRHIRRTNSYYKIVKATHEHLKN